MIFLARCDFPEAHVEETWQRGIKQAKNRIWRIQTHVLSDSSVSCGCSATSTASRKIARMAIKNNITDKRKSVRINMKSHTILYCYIETNVPCETIFCNPRTESKVGKRKFRPESTGKIILKTEPANRQKCKRKLKIEQFLAKTAIRTRQKPRFHCKTGQPAGMQVSPRRMAWPDAWGAVFAATTVLLLSPPPSSHGPLA